MKEIQEIIANFKIDLENQIPNYVFLLSETTITLLRDLYIAKETEEIDMDRKKLLDSLWENNIINIRKNLYLDDYEVNVKKDTLK